MKKLILFIYILLICQFEPASADIITTKKEIGVNFDISNDENKLHINDLNLSHTRTFVKASDLDSEPDSFKNLIFNLDTQIQQNNENKTIVFISDKHKLYNDESKYSLLSSRELSDWSNIIKRVVERYDGDTNYDCNPDLPENDCYEAEDGLYPNEELRNAIEENPIKNWQIENEWLTNIVNKKNNAPINAHQYLSHLNTISTSIKSADPNSLVILGALTDLTNIINLNSDPETTVFHSEVKNCSHEVKLFKDLSFNERRNLELLESKISTVLYYGAKKYDAIDIHLSNNSPEDILNVSSWINLKLASYKILSKNIYLNDIASSNYFATKCNDDSPSNLRIHSIDLTKRVVYGLASFDRVVYSSLNNDLKQNPTKDSLISEKGEKFPAYYALKLLNEKLNRSNKVEMLNETTFKFSFPHKSPIVIAWADNKKERVNLLKYLRVNRTAVKVTRVPTEIESSNNAVGIIMNSRSVHADEVPIIIELLGKRKRKIL